MAQIEKTVFISYRRKDISWALLVYEYLDQKYKYDVFFDFTSIPSGDFEQFILSNIKARAHFVLILTPTALDRCNEPGDWLRREIEFAIDQKRNIIPLLVDKFSFSSPTVSDKLTGKLSTLKRYNGLEVPPNYFKEAMGRLRKQYLNTPLDAVLHPISMEVQEIVKQEQAAAHQALVQRSTNSRESSAKPEISESSIEPTPQSTQGKKVEDINEVVDERANEISSNLVQQELEAERNTLFESAVSRQPGQLTFYPTVELTLRTEPVISTDTVIRRIPVTEELLSLEPASAAIPKVGVKNRWLKVKDLSGRVGYVAAWCVTATVMEPNRGMANKGRNQRTSKAILGSLAEEASSEIVQQELEAMSRAGREAVEKMKEPVVPLQLRLQQIAQDYVHVIIGRNTVKEELNAILASYPKTGDVKG
jgi:hypothetical protein